MEAKERVKSIYVSGAGDEETHPLLADGGLKPRRQGGIPPPPSTGHTSAESRSEVVSGQWAFSRQLPPGAGAGQGGEGADMPLASGRETGSQ